MLGIIGPEMDEPEALPSWDSQCGGEQLPIFIQHGAQLLFLIIESVYWKKTQKLWLQSLGSNLNYLWDPWIVLVKIQYLIKYYYLHDIILYV